MAIDSPEVKIVTCDFNNNPFFIGIGVANQKEVKGSGQVDITKGVRGEYQTQKDMEWQFMVNPNALPTGFMPLDKMKELITATAAVSSGSAFVYNSPTFKTTTPEILSKSENSLAKIRDRDVLKLLSKQGLVIDHIIPRSKGGTDDISNLRIMTKEENIKKADKTVEEMKD
jgi:hypothetical protein